MCSAIKRQWRSRIVPAAPLAFVAHRFLRLSSALWRPTFFRGWRKKLVWAVSEDSPKGCQQRCRFLPPVLNSGAVSGGPWDDGAAMWRKRAGEAPRWLQFDLRHLATPDAPKRVGNYTTGGGCSLKGPFKLHPPPVVCLPTCRRKRARSGKRSGSWIGGAGMRQWWRETLGSTTAELGWAEKKFLAQGASLTSGAKCACGRARAFRGLRMVCAGVLRRRNRPL